MFAYILTERKSRRQKPNKVIENDSAPHLIHHTVKVPVVPTPSSMAPILVVGEYYKLHIM